MAREHCRILVSRWNNPDFVRLDRGTQWLYDALLTQPDVTTCGVLPYVPGRWTALAPGLSARKLELECAELERNLFVVVDKSTAELFIRSHFRHDKPLNNTNTAKAVARTWTTVRSKKIRRAVLVEIQRLHNEPEFGDWPGWKLLEIKELVAMDLVAL